MSMPRTVGGSFIVSGRWVNKFCYRFQSEFVAQLSLWIYRDDINLGGLQLSHFPLAESVWAG
jgi:hypothetical protein